MPYENLNQVLFMQTRIVNLFRKTKHLTTSQFLELDKKCDILGFVAESYEPFHLTGDQGILEEVVKYADEETAAVEAKSY